MLNERPRRKKPDLTVREEPRYINDGTKLFRKQFWLVDPNFCLCYSDSYKVCFYFLSLPSYEIPRQNGF